MSFLASFENNLNQTGGKALKGNANISNSFPYTWTNSFISVSVVASFKNNVNQKGGKAMKGNARISNSFPNMD